MQKVSISTFAKSCIFSVSFKFLNFNGTLMQISKLGYFLTSIFLYLFVNKYFGKFTGN